MNRGPSNHRVQLHLLRPGSRHLPARVAAVMRRGRWCPSAGSRPPTVSSGRNRLEQALALPSTSLSFSAWSLYSSHASIFVGSKGTQVCP